MAELGIVFPMLPGKRPALEAFAGALAGPRRDEYASSQISVLQESWFVQNTPGGDLIIVHLEAADPGAVFANLAASREPFDIWFREQTHDITGIDLTQMPAALPEKVFQWARK